MFGLARALVGLAYLSSVAFLPVTVAAVVFYTFPVLIVLTEPLCTPAASARTGSRSRSLPSSASPWSSAPTGTASIRADSRSLWPPACSPPRSSSRPRAAPRQPRCPKLFWSHLHHPAGTLAILCRSPAGSCRPQALALAPLAVAVTIGGYLIGFLLQLLALARVAPGPAALAFCAEPVFAVAIAAVVLGERLGSLQYAGGALVVARASSTNVILEQKRAPPCAGCREGASRP